MPTFALLALNGDIWIFWIVTWMSSVSVWASLYFARKFRRRGCKGRYRFFLVLGLLLAGQTVLFGAFLLRPGLFSSDIMQGVLTSYSFILPVTVVIVALLLRRFEAKNPEEAERSYRVEDEIIRLGK